MELLIKLRDIFQELRWQQWWKNLFIFLVLLWAPHVTYSQVSALGVGFIALCISSSIVYIFNDLKDIELDRKHPLKKERPIAAGKITGIEAYSLLLILTGLLFIIVALLNNVWFTGLILVQIIVNLAYTFGLKHVSYVDLFTVASLLILRAITGFMLLDVAIPIFMMIAIFFFSMFIMTMQRIAEYEIVRSAARPALKGYSLQMLHLLLTVSMMITSVFYFIAFAFVSLPLAYTDILYFLSLATINDFMTSSTTKKDLAQNELMILFTNKRVLTYVVLFILVVITILIWFR